MWAENSPQKTEESLVESALGEAEKKIQVHEASRSDAAWNTDTLKICHDASMCAKLLAACVSNEKTKRLAKVTHLKEQNSIGASMVTKFAKSNCNHIPLACPTADQSLAEDRYGKHAPNNFEFKFRFFEIII